jgi:hypothetical protein
MKCRIGNETLMDMTSLLISALFGLIGMAIFAYGKRQGRFVPLGAGAALMALPCFIPNVIAMLVICSAITLLPMFVQDS